MSGSPAPTTARSAGADPPRRRRLARLGLLLGGGLRAAPVTTAMLAGIWVVGLAGRSVVHGPSRWQLGHIGVGLHPLEAGHWWTPLTSLGLARGVSGYLLATAALVLLAAPAERRLGAARFVVAGVVGQVLGTTSAVGVVALVALAPGDWARQLERAVQVGPTPFALAALLAASAGMGTLWRRRLRIGTFAVLVTLVLYSGFLHDLAATTAAVVGLIVGPLLLGRSGGMRRITGTRREGRVLVALVVAAAAVGPVLAAFSPQAVGPLSVLARVFTSAPPDAAEVFALCADPDRAEECAELQAQLRLSGVGPLILSLLPSLLLVVLADGLRRGRRFAWTGAVLLTALLTALAVRLSVAALRTGNSVALGAGTGRSVPVVRDLVVPALGPGMVLLLLLASASLFDVAAPRRTYRGLLTFTLGLGGALLVGYVALGALVRDGFRPAPGVWDLVVDFPRRLVPPGYLVETAPPFLPTSAPATLLYEWTGTVFWLALAAQALLTFVRGPGAHGAGDRARAVSLLQASGGSTLSWLTTWRGTRYWFTPTGNGYVAYRVHVGVAIAVGDPVGPGGEMAEAIRGFAEFAADRGWAVCLYSVTDTVRAACGALGWEHLQVAEETSLDLPTLEFKGKKFQDVRTALNRAAKEGITARWVGYRTAPLAITDQITAISEEWVADQGLPEMGFTLGGLDEVDDPAVRCLIAVDATGTVHAVTSWMPVYRDGVIDGWTLDFMRRRSDGFRPAIEFLIASAALLCKDEGARVLSLSGAPLARVPHARDSTAVDVTDDAGTGTVDRLLALLGRVLEPVYGFGSLLAFKAKFQPTYSPLFLCYPDPAALPSIGNAVGRAYLPAVSFTQGVALARQVAGGVRATGGRRPPAVSPSSPPPAAPHPLASPGTTAASADRSQGAPP